ncbi:uncharacterized protein LOC109537819 [Dendroctonus ponderosae]|uniref:TRAF-type domain-containing protein n=1 Tax=Dendroctonus ponderosae TaxID=77166 RepID=A0AAR5PHC6_DENPD|nr:uncharacterized protein LOC109537819 [Dendroctonus ponderosae]XP_019760281.1 uncharacterized protein LOC109537819 [Dendroctonus ponderosae]XP_019760282.1 uncharacterized protein LOC109537819 [Dendroctonus ponderosae]XP_019760283.1 uncharacterized protein LOC109537819 [Dendroctonus ponderosae]XP_019760284.1 uncharacterized protein LOC109537819 [Dendroctonus ponderosae]KAH1015994.1 hypothetical protein HUJ04_007290 [Dendroctonus ponderosae]KAH1015995.1 hypothetical protein HUJ04_007290 [Dend
MQQLSDISFSFLATQTCTHCELPVTCGPVYVVNDLSILCGRCRMSAKDHYRNFAYEGLASTFLYPCKNWRNNCSVKLRWNDSLDHEYECNYVGCCTFLCSHPGAFFKGQRDLPRDEIRLVYVPDNLLEYLECVICRGYLNSSPVYIQSNGQNVCHRCIYANGNPPNCRRNDAYENFSQIFLFPCTYRNRGCKERLQFGKAVWNHESKCEYGPNLPQNSTFAERAELVRNSLRPQQDAHRLSSRQRQPQPAHVHSSNNNERSENSEPQDPVVRPKEKGLIRTHTGHIWATITPSKALFAPPDDDRPDVNQEILKSIAKKQVRQIRRADDIGQWDENGGKNWDNESVSTSTSYSYKTSGHSTPEPLDSSRRLYNPPDDYQRDYPTRPDSRESGYNTGLIGNGQLQGQYPILMPHHLSNGYDSPRRISSRDTSQRESVKGNGLLISELKLRQDLIKRTHSIKGDRDAHSPYKQNNNFDNIIEPNRHIR